VRVDKFINHHDDNPALLVQGTSFFPKDYTISKIL
jgi:hypothetical protein